MADDDDNTYQATILKGLTRYQESADIMINMIKENPVLSENQRELFYDIFKSWINEKRESRSELISGYQRSANQGNIIFSQKLTEIIIDNSNTISDICKMAIDALDTHLIPASTDPSNIAYYHKARADFYRYILESNVDDDAIVAKEESSKSYKIAMDIVTNNMLPANPLRLSVELNYAVFLFNHQQNCEEAIELLNTVIPEAEANTDSVEEEKLSDAIGTIRQMRENVALWTASNETEE